MIEFRMPSLGSDMDQGKLLKWLVQPGDTVHKGQVIAVVDTSKAAIDVECWHDGVVRALMVEPDAVIPVGMLMAVLRAPGERIEDVDAQLAGVLAATQVAAPAATLGHGGAPHAAASLAETGAHTGQRQLVSPAARRRAQQLGVDAESIRGSGPLGAVTLADVETLAAQVGHVAPASPASAAPATPVTRATPPALPTPLAPPPRAMSGTSARAAEMRKVIGAAMARSKREIPHYYLAEDILFANAAAWLAQRNADLPVTQRLLPAALLIKAVAVALHRYPEFNGFWRDGAFATGAGVHLGVAISLREGGLVAPALRDAARLDIAALTRALLDLVKRTRAGSLRSSELADATITVTNLGEQGVSSVFGVIYPPQVALVGFGRIAPRPWVVDGAVSAWPALTASLAADHRVSDGHRGALLLAEIRELLQDPQTLDAPMRAAQPI